MKAWLRMLFALCLVVAVLLGLALPLGVQAVDTTVLVGKLEPSWTAPGGGGVFSAYVGPPDYGYVSPGSTAVYDGREGGIIKAGLNADPDDGHYWDEGLFGFKPTVTIDTFAAGTVSYDVETEYGENPVWMTIEIDTGEVGNRNDNTTYQRVPESNPAGWHTVDATSGTWNKWLDNDGTIDPDDPYTLSTIATAHTGLNVVRAYLRLGMGDSYHGSAGLGTVAWVDKTTLGGVTYDFVVMPPLCTTDCYVDATTGDDAYPGSSDWPMKTIQKAIDTVTSGGTVHAAAGTYAEDLVIDHGVDLVCANEGIDPNEEEREEETIIVPATNKPDYTEYGTIIDLQGSNVTIDGCTFDGDNPLLDGFDMGGADINTNAAIDNGGYYVLDHLRVQNNIIRNLMYSSIYLDTPYGENHSSNYIVHNLFENMWEGIQIYAAETDVSDNVFSDVTRAISYHQVNAAPDAGFAPRIANNEVTVTYNWGDTDRNVGIWVNGRHGPAADLDITGNVVNTPSAMPEGKEFWGYALYNVTDDTAVTFSGNTLNGEGNCDVGLWAWYIDSTSPVVLGGGGGGGLYGAKSTGVLLSNYHSTWGAGPTALTLDGLPITVGSSGTVVKVWQGTTEPTGGRVEPVRNGKAFVAPKRVAPESTSSSLTITSGTYSGGAIGIDVDGGTATVSGATVSGNGTGVYIHNGGTGTFTDDCFSGNTSYGMNNTTGTSVAATANWWGNASGPYHPTINPTGTGDTVSDDVGFAPWISDGCHGTATEGHWLNLRTGAYGTLAGSLAAASTGDTIQGVCSGSTPIAGGGTATVGGVTIDLNGCTAGPGSPFLTVAADDVVVSGPGILDGSGSADPAIVVKAGAGNFILEGVEVTGWSDGVLLEGSVVSFKMGENFFHDNSLAGLHVGTGATLSGVVTIEGNLFKDNGGPGIQNEGATVPLPAAYNSWGDLAGPTGTLGDGVGDNVTYTPWTFAEVFLDMYPDIEAVVHRVIETTSFDVKLKADAAKLYGLTFLFSYDTAKLTLGTTTFSAPWAGHCSELPSLDPGEIGYFCNLSQNDPPADPDAEWDADGGTIATFHFTAFAGTPGNGPWPALFDISHLEEDTGASAIGGQKVFVNNAGFNDPSSEARDITDEDDGQIIIERLANYTGFVDLQGRLNDSLAVVEAHATSAYGSLLLARGESDSSGAYTTAHIAPNWMGVGNTYWIQIDRDLYLPTTYTYPSPAASYAHSKLLSDYPTTALSKVDLLGGDASNDNYVNVQDLACIGADYRKTSDYGCGTTGSSDVNGDGKVSVQDLAMTGGNYYKTSSPWAAP